MVQFWLDNFMDLFNLQNVFINTGTKSENYLKALNIVAFIAIVVGLLLVFITKNVTYFGMTIIILSITILVKSNININSFTEVNEMATKISNSWDTGAYLIKPSLTNKLYINEALNFNKGDVIALTDNGVVLETNIVSSVHINNNGTPILTLLNNLSDKYPTGTHLSKVSNAAPSIIPPPDANRSIEDAGMGSGDPHTEVLKNYPQNDIPNENRFDWNLELSTIVPGTQNQYPYQGQPYGDLRCRNPSVSNPMGTVNITEYDAAPTMFGTCNVAEDAPDGRKVDYNMTNDQEATVSQSRNDLLFHRGNSQWQYSPVPVDTIPNNQEAFAHFCYRSPTNLVNPKYASIFVNDPEKYKLVAKLARATGTENGGGGGGH